MISADHQLRLLRCAHPCPCFRAYLPALGRHPLRVVSRYLPSLRPTFGLFAFRTFQTVIVEALAAFNRASRICLRNAELVSAERAPHINPSQLDFQARKTLSYACFKRNSSAHIMRHLSCAGKIEHSSDICCLPRPSWGEGLPTFGR